MCMSLVVGVTAQRVNCLVADLMECGTHRGFERDLVIMMMIVLREGEH